MGNSPLKLALCNTDPAEHQHQRLVTAKAAEETAANAAQAAELEAGKHAYVLGDLDRAKRSFALLEDRKEASVFLGNIALSEGDAPAATAYFREALSYAPSSAVALFNLSTALHREGKLQEAMGELERLLGLHPDHSDGAFNLAVMKHQAGELTVARVYYGLALELNPSCREARTALKSLPGTSGLAG